MGPLATLARLWGAAGTAVYGRCHVWTPELVHYHIVGDLLIWSAYVAIPAGIAHVARRHLRGYLPLCALGALFVLSCGMTHAMSVYTVYAPALWLEGHVKLATGLVSWTFVVLMLQTITRLDRAGAAVSAYASRFVESAAGVLRSWTVPGFGILVMLAAGVTTYRAASGFVTESDQRRRSVEKVRAAERYLAAVCDAETGQRGFLLLSDERYLAPYEEAVATVPKRRAALRAAGLVDPVLDAAVDAKLAELAETIALGRAQRYEALFAAVRSGRGFTLMRQIRARVRLVEDQDERVLVSWRRAIEAMSQVLVALPVGSASAALILTFAFAALQRELAARRVAEARSVAALARLEANEAALRRSNADLEQFAYAASHDLQEPLRQIAGFTQLLASRYGGQFDEKAQRWMERVVDGAKRMQAMISDLLTYSRLSRHGIALAAVRLDDAVEEALSNLAQLIEDSGAACAVRGLPIVQGDRPQLVTLFQNLISNAIKYRVPDRSVRILVSATVSKDEVLVAVRDNGRGIEGKYHERIFEMFTRVGGTTSEKGTGIGLAIARRVLERHGGRIWVESVPGVGSTFFCAFPRQKASLDERGHPPGGGQ